MSSQRFGAPPYLGLGASKIVLIAGEEGGAAARRRLRLALALEELWKHLSLK